MDKRRRIALYAAIIVVGIILDQLTKELARTYLSPVGSGSITLIPGVMDLKLIMNTGAAFSIGSGSTWVFIIVALVIVVAATVWVVRENSMPAGLVVSLAMVASGGIGNLIDRVAVGEVTDFLATSFIDFPVFNVADIFVTCGVVLAFIFTMRFDSTDEDA